MLKLLYPEEVMCYEYTYVYVELSMFVWPDVTILIKAVSSKYLPVSTKIENFCLSKL